MTTETNTTRPTHRVYAVIKRAGAAKANWTEMGAAWPHRDGKGFNIKLDLIPTGNAEIVIREASVEGGGQ